LGRLEGKVAFLTGAGSGIARASAQAFSREGAKVAIAEVNVEAGRRTEQQIREAGGDALFVETDVLREDSIASAVAATVARFGRLDAMFNCVGGSSAADVSVHEADLGVWQHVIALNLLATMLCCRHGLPHIMEAGGGSIINVVSHRGLMGSERPAYAASKGGIMALTRTLAAQYSDHGVRCNAIAPGSIEKETPTKDREAMKGRSPSRTGRERIVTQKLWPFSVGVPRDIAGIAVFLASDESRMITGSTIAADGGRSSILKVHAPEGVTMDLLNPQE
jgi:NAD(P)-dependent dehydrogenase (short-subunit alcohol dehydrogenase family)